MTEQERELLGLFLRSGMILCAITLVPIALITGLLGPVLGLIAFGVAIPLSAHLGGVVPLGATHDAALERVKDPDLLRRIGSVSAICVLFGMNVLMLVPAELSRIPAVAILISSYYIMGLYLLGARGGDPDKALSRIGAPVAVVILATLVQI
jgi:hypothetical protein